MKFIKTALLGMVVVGIVSVALELFYNEDVEVIKQISATSTEAVVENIDVIDSARAELERINAELDNCLLYTSPSPRD